MKALIRQSTIGNLPKNFWNQFIKIITYNFWARTPICIKILVVSANVVLTSSWLLKNISSIQNYRFDFSRFSAYSRDFSKKIPRSNTSQPLTKVIAKELCESVDQFKCHFVTNKHHSNFIYFDRLSKIL